MTGIPQTLAVTVFILTPFGMLRSMPNELIPLNELNKIYYMKVVIERGA